MNGQGKPAPERIGKYDIVGVLGQGGMGVVYRARDPRIGRDVAIKTLTEGFSGDPEMLKRFYQEAGQTGNLRHPNIVTVYDFGDEEGLPYIVMEFLDGEPLDKIIRLQQPLHLGARLDIIEQVCSALAYAHLQGIIHRDVKPANVIVQRDGLVKLLDFGIARTGQPYGQSPGQAIDRSMTRTGTLVGTPAYMAPERLRGEPFDGRSDIFSTGVVLYQLVTGALPFDAEYPAILHQILQEAPPPLSKYLSAYPPLLEQVISRALAKDPFERYAHSSDMAADLNGVGSQLKLERVGELFAEAQAAVAAENYVEARSLLSQLLRMNSQHAEAKQLLASVDQYFNLQKTRERIEQLKRAALEALATRNWEPAIAWCNEALHLEPENAEIAALLAQANTGKQTLEQVQRLMRDAESARHSGNFELAREFAGKAADLDRTDTRILAICKVLDQEVDEARRKAQLRKLLHQAQESLAAARLTEAFSAITQAEELAPSDAELLRLKDELGSLQRQQERKRLVNDLQEKSAVALSLEQIQEVAAEVAAALEKFPTEPTLLRLKIQIEPRLREHERKRLVAEVSDACRHLPPVEALARIRDALAQLPGNEELLKLESAISQRLTREQREQILADYLRKAHVLLQDHLYLETAKVLEQCEKEGFSSPEMTELLNLARSAAAERISQDLVERTFLEAKQLLEAEDYEAVLKLLPPVLERVDEPALRRQLDEATQKQAVLEKRIRQVLDEIDRSREMELFDAAIGLIHSEPAGVRQSRRVQSALETLTAARDLEAARLASAGQVYAALNEAESAALYQRLTAQGAASTSPAGTLAGLASPAGATSTAGVDSILQRLGARLRQIADQQLGKSIESARQALAAEDAAAAHTVLENAAGWQPSASAPLQSDWKTAQEEVAAARKVLRFRKSSRR
jgi:eukaryotic-like serine/threonine-protein kinase